MKKILRQHKLIVVIMIALVALLFVFTSRQAEVLIPNEAEVGFAQDMSVHHEQAVEMSFIIRKSSDNEAIRDFAFDIINTQATQRGMMLGWLDLWNQPFTTNETPMMWMHDMSTMNHMEEMNSTFTPGAYMPGMATDEEMQALTEADGEEAEQLFLELMIRHHQGGVMMAEGVIERSNSETVTRLAQTMVNGQKAEIDYMETLLINY